METCQCKFSDMHGATMEITRFAYYYYLRSSISYNFAFWPFVKQKKCTCNGTCGKCHSSHSFRLNRKKQNIMLVHVLREYNVNRILLSYLGLWPFQSKFVRCFLPICYFVLVTSNYPLAILMLYDHSKNVRLVFEAGYQIIIVNTFNIKLLCQFWNHDKIRQLYETIEKHWNIFTSEYEVQVLKHYSDMSRKLVIIYSATLYIMGMIFIMIPLMPIFLDIVRPLNETRPRFHIITIAWRIDPDKYFVPIYFYMTSTIMAGIIIVAGIDTMQINCTIHACSLFSVIGHQFKNITLKLYNEEKISQHWANTNHELLDDKVMYQKYVMCLKKYQLAIEFVNIINSIYRTIALNILLVSVAIISLVGVRIVYVLDQLEEVIRYSFVIMGMLMQLLVICYSSQKLIDLSQNIFYQAYAAKWYRFSPKLKSLLIITLYKSITPCNLTAGNMFSLSMQTFGMVLRTGISYFMTFLSLKR